MAKKIIRCLTQAESEAVRNGATILHKVNGVYVPVWKGEDGRPMTIDQVALWDGFKIMRPLKEGYDLALTHLNDKALMEGKVVSQEKGGIVFNLYEDENGDLKGNFENPASMFLYYEDMH